MTEAAKAARRIQIQRELSLLRNRRHDSISERNRMNAQIDDLSRARNQLHDCLSSMSDIRRKVRDCHNVVDQRDFKGNRRREIESRLNSASERVNAQRNRHVENRDRIIRQIETLRARRDSVNGTINTQNARITALEAELRNLW